MRLSRVLFGVFGTIAVSAILGGLGLLALMHHSFTAAGPMPNGDTETVINIPRGTGLSAISRNLENEGVVTSALIFQIGVRLSGGATDLKAGEYAIPPGASMQEIMDLFRSGLSILHKLTVPEGLTSSQIMRLVDAHEILVGELPEALPEEGDLLPETYLFSRGETRDGVIRQMAEAHDKVLAELWAGRQEDLPISTPYEAVILASIVEKETGVAEERPRVASVFINRLRRGMRLQSDPTIIYGLTKGEPLGRGIRQSELDRETPYNTYFIDGLPPTPIANPGRAALAAVLNPPETKDLYFVADGTGGHVFAETLRQHQRNVAAWRRIERDRKRQN